MKTLISILVMVSSMGMAETSSKYEKESAKLQELRKQVRDQLKESNEQVQKNYQEAKELSTALLNIAAEETPKIASLKEQQKWAEAWQHFSKRQDALRKSNKEFGRIWEERTAIYERQGKLLRELSPEYKAQSKLVWELKQAQ